MKPELGEDFRACETYQPVQPPEGWPFVSGESPRYRSQHPGEKKRIPEGSPHGSEVRAGRVYREESSREDSLPTAGQVAEVSSPSGS